MQNLSDIFNVVSEQSTARPGCIIQLDTIIDATHDWQNTQFLHVFQEGLITGERNSSKSERNIFCEGSGEDPRKALVSFLRGVVLIRGGNSLA